MVWVDQGLFFTLILNVVAMAIMLPIAFYLHSSPKKHFARLFRPNQINTDGSNTPSASILTSVSSCSRLFWRVSISTIDFWLGRLDFRFPSEEESLARFQQAALTLEKEYSLIPGHASTASCRLQTDPQFVLHLLFYKVSAFILIFGGLGTVWTAVAASTDNHLIRFNAANDPQKCAGKAAAQCIEDAFCEYLDGACRPTTRNGLFDLSVQNIAPRDWRWFIFAFGNLWFALVTAFAMYNACKLLAAYMPLVSQRQMMNAVGYRTVLVWGLDPAAEASGAAVYQPNQHEHGNAGIGSTTDSENGGQNVALAAFTEELRNVREVFLKKYVRNEAYFKPDPSDADLLREYDAGRAFFPGNGKLSVQKTKAADGSGAELAVASRKVFLSATITTTEQEIDLASEVENIAFECVSSNSIELEGFVKEYECARLALEDAILGEVAWRKEETEAKMREKTKKTGADTKENVAAEAAAAVEVIIPSDQAEAVMMQRVPAKCFAKVPAVEYAAAELTKAADQVNAGIEQLLSELRQNLILEQVEGSGTAAHFTGAVAIRFRSSRVAYEFENLFSAAFGTDSVLSNRRVAIAGTPAGLETQTLAAHVVKVRLMYLLFTIIFVFLVFFWAVPVALLGSLDSLAAMPSPVGPIFVTFTKNIPVTVRGTLQAYLPVIVLVIFNIVLPSMIRAFARMKGHATQRDVESSSLKMLSTFMVMTGVVMQAVLQGGLFQLSAVVQNPTQEAVVAMIIAIVSPQGGYWYATTLTAAFLSTFLNALLLGPVIVSRITAKSCFSQRQYDDLYKPQTVDLTVILSTDAVILAVGMFFHGTVPLLALCSGCYFLMKFWVFRWLLLDVCEPVHRPDDEAVTDLSQYTYMFRLITLFFVISSFGCTLVTALQMHTGGIVVCGIAAVVSVAVHVYVNLSVGGWEPSLITARLLLPLSSPERRAPAADEEECDAYFPRNKLWSLKPIDPKQAIEEVKAKCGAEVMTFSWDEDERSGTLSHNETGKVLSSVNHEVHKPESDENIQQQQEREDGARDSQLTVDRHQEAQQEEERSGEENVEVENS
jgi:hypothetical protein